MKPELAIIGGTGVYDPSLLTNLRGLEVETRYGMVALQCGEFAGRGVAFLARHGVKHTVPPHLINFRANIAALKQLGVEQVIATAAVGSLNPEMRPGDFVLVDQFIDFTKSRGSTFHEGGVEGVAHLDVSDPYCSRLRTYLDQAAKAVGVGAHYGGTYVCTEGPRFETPAEIRMFRIMGSDVVGMTSVPEVVLAKEAGMCYATIAMVTNFAAGISTTPLTHAEVLEKMAENAANFRLLVMKALEIVGRDRNCSCPNVEAPLGI